MIKTIMNRLKIWLFREELEQLEKAADQYKNANDRLISAADCFMRSHEQCQESDTLLRNCYKMMESLIDVGADIGFHSDDHSWAVVCIKGHPEYVKFIPLDHRNAQDIISFLRHFEYSNRVVDSPFAFRDMIENRVTTNPFLQRE